MRKILRLVANLKVAIILLLLIAISSSLGSVIEQEKDVNFYITQYPNSNFLPNVLDYEIILSLGLNNLYQTVWFNFLLAIFGVCLISCTFLQQIPLLKVAKQYNVLRTVNPIKKLPCQFITENNGPSWTKLLLNMTDCNYSIFQQYNRAYSYKGLIGRLSPIVVHLSILLILLGSFLGACTGFTAQELIPKTESTHIQNIISSGYFSTIIQRTARVNDFWIEYEGEKNIKQFYSDLSIIDGKGKELTRKSISVNTPLFFKGLTFYQTEWDLMGIRFKVNERFYQTIVSKLSDEKRKSWIGWISFNKVQNFIFIIKDMRGQIELYDTSGNFISFADLNDSLIDNNSVFFSEIIPASGIQIKIDNSIIPVYGGFFFLIISSLLSYLSFSEIYLLKEEALLIFGGKTNRAKVEFELEAKMFKTKIFLK